MRMQLEPQPFHAPLDFYSQSVAEALAVVVMDHSAKGIQLGRHGQLTGSNTLSVISPSRTQADHHVVGTLDLHLYAASFTGLPSECRARSSAAICGNLQ
jgi:hypothetical protein